MLILANFGEAKTKRQCQMTIGSKWQGNSEVLKISTVAEFSSYSIGLAKACVSELCGVFNSHRNREEGHDTSLGENFLGKWNFSSSKYL